MFKVQYILMKALALLLWVSSHVLLEFVKMSVKDMHFERNSLSHFSVILYESLNQLHIVFSLVITQEAMNNCNETVPNRFLLPVQQLGQLVTFYDPLDPLALTFASDSFEKRTWRYLKAADSLSRAVTNYLIRPNLMCSGGISTFWGSISGSHWTLLFPTENLVRCGQFFLW